MRDVGMVMPVYNQDPLYLTLAMNSVLRQSYPHFHLAVVIDGANEQTRNQVYQYRKDPRITIIDKPVNEGISQALNTGFNYLLGLKEVHYLTWGSSDNVLYTDFFMKLRQALVNAAPSVGLAYSSFHHMDEHGNVIHSHEQHVKFRSWQQTRTLNDLMDSSFIGASFMYKKRYARLIDGYYLDPVQTYDYWLRLTEKCGITYIPEELMAYRFHSPTSLSREIHLDKQKHRWWRNQFNLARHKARMRRQIGYETVILYPVYRNDWRTVEHIEQLLDQQYHNYRLFLVDKTHQISNMLNELGIADPRISVIPKSGPDSTLLNDIHVPPGSRKLILTEAYDLSRTDALTRLLAQQG
ncbi:glycosyltransferase [Paenibacillus tarimensis]|uniref:glycosyltransferase n=1 Tax=Paenibacillus tarimensis TaxID=416012 RepID=UPI001F45B4FC|nr:glycosyltransferase [Paenibacillus tarimensis]MCF2943587.1 glycosyltransferase [Paenibacillus tarimensis]